MYYISKVVMDIAIIWWVVTKEWLADLVAEYRAYIRNNLKSLNLEVDDLPGTPWGRWKRRRKTLKLGETRLQSSKYYGMHSEEYENMRVFNVLVGDLEQTCKDKLGKEFPWEGTEEQESVDDQGFPWRIENVIQGCQNSPHIDAEGGSLHRWSGSWDIPETLEAEYWKTKDKFMLLRDTWLRRRASKDTKTSDADRDNILFLEQRLGELERGWIGSRPDQINERSSKGN